MSNLTTEIRNELQAGVERSTDYLERLKFKQKMLEKDKYDALMSLDKDVIKLYFVNDPKGNFLYWLNNLQMPIPVKKYCPDTTMWTKKRLLKDVYLLEENDASIININISEK